MRVTAAFDGPFHVVGHSMGGAVAMQLALTMPERIKSFSVIEPVLFHLLRDGTASDRALHANVDALARRMQDAAAEDAPATASEAAMAQFIEFWGGAGAWDALKPAQRAALAPKASTVADNFAALAAAQFPLAAVARIAAPALVLMGSESRAETQRIAAKLFGSLPFATLGIVRGAGHMLPLTHGANVNDRLTAHIDAVESGALAAAIARKNAA
jgi:pimeloyl-ACP methyl ester carboxylesterase